MKKNYLLLICWILSGLTALHAQSPRLLKDINPGTGVSAALDFTEYNGMVYFRANDGTNGIELWRSDGTEAGTTLVADINEGSANSLPTNFIVFDGKLIFRANNGTDGTEPYVYDGDTIIQLKDINPTGSSNPANYTEFMGKLYFTATDGSSGTQLWVTDGTPEGTMLALTVNPDGNANPNNYFIFQDHLYFQADNGVVGRELFKYNGTELSLVADINEGAGNSSPSDFIVYEDKLYFQANPGTGNELYAYDGANPPTVPISGIQPNEMVIYNDSLFISGRNEANERVLFLFNPEPLEVTQLTEGDIFPRRFAVSNGILFFAADDGETALQLWSYNGTDAPALLKVIREGGTSNPLNLTDINDRLYFTANDGDGTGAAARIELWTSDGTVDGTRRVVEERINPDGNAVAGNLYWATDMEILFFSANNGTTGAEPWVLTLGAPELSIQQEGEVLANGATFSLPDVDIDDELEVAFLLANTGKGDMVINDITLSGSAIFSLVGGLPDGLLLKASDTLRVLLNATEAGLQEAVLTVAIDGIDDYAVTLSTTVIGVPELVVRQGGEDLTSGSAFSFADTDFSDQTDVAFTLANVGTGLLTITEISLTGSSSFAFVGDLPTFVAAGGTEAVTVRFASSDFGSQQAQLTIAGEGIDDFVLNLAGIITSLDEEASKALQVFPNPASGLINVDWSALGQRQATQLRVLDTQGREVNKLLLSGQSQALSIDMENLAPGVYMLEFTGPSLRATRRVLKQ